MTTVAPSHTLTRGDFDEQVADRRTDDDVDYSGWFCIATRPFACPAADCDFVAVYVTAAHLIVVWPARDDRMLLNVARDARELGREPRIVEYHPSVGPCIPYDYWRQLGGPVHGKLPDPHGWNDLPKL